MLDSEPVAVDSLGFGMLDFTCNRYCGCHRNVARHDDGVIIAPQ